LQGLLAAAPRESPKQSTKSVWTSTTESETYLAHSQRDAAVSGKDASVGFALKLNGFSDTLCCNLSVPLAVLPSERSHFTQLSCEVFPVIEARSLSKRFHDKKRGEIRAVDNVSFVAKPGQIYGLLGANGAGKTTTLRLLATILEPSEGTAIVNGHDVVDSPEKVRASVGFLSGGTALYPRLTAQEMVEYFGRLNGLDEPTLKKRVDEIFNRLDMNEFRDRRCDKLSTGMKQKTSIARTLVHDPPVMIFDEPTSGLDVMTARTIMGFIRECRDRGKTVIFSTHVMSEVEKLCDRIGIIHGGKLLAEGTLADLRAQFGMQDLEDLFVKVLES
jgi:sodium transport system ATP-binding protein